MTDEQQIPEQTPDNTVKDVKSNPCGCKLVTFESERQLFSPCPPCGIFQAAESMQNAAKALAGEDDVEGDPAEHIQRAAMAFAAVATTLQEEQHNALRKQQMVEMITAAQRQTAEQDAADLDKPILRGPGSEGEA